MSDLELMGISEIAALRGWSKQRAFIAANTKGFPDPITKLKMGTIWVGRAVRAHFAEIDRRKKQ